MVTRVAARLLWPCQRRGAVWVGLGCASVVVNQLWGLEMEEAHQDMACDGIDGWAEELHGGGLDRRLMVPARTSRSSVEPMWSLGRRRGQRSIVGGSCRWCGTLRGWGKQPSSVVVVNAGLSGLGIVAWRQLQEARLGPAWLTMVGLWLGATVWLYTVVATQVLQALLARHLEDGRRVGKRKRA
jgi:hypothetical protein